MANTHIDEMSDALAANIEYLKENGSSQITIRNGELEQEAGDLYIYRFETDFETHVDTDAEIEVFVRGDNTSGKIISIEDKVIRVELQRNIGSHIAEARLIISSYYLLERLKERMVEDKPKSNLGDKLFNITASYRGQSLEAKNTVGSEELNDYQTDALKSALENEVTYIWGPPGTGKTQTIASIIDAYNGNGLSVLLLSHTNIATDEALYKTSKHLKKISNDDFLEGRVIRVGKVQHKPLEEDFGKYVIPEKIIERKTESIRQDIERCNKEIANTAVKMKPLKEKLVKIDDYTQLVRKIRQKQDFLSVQEAAYKEIQSKFELLTTDLKDVKARKDEFLNKGKLARMLSSDSEDKFQSFEARIKSDKRLLKEKAESIVEASIPEKRELKLLEAEAKKLGVTFGDIDPKPIRSKLESFEQDIKALNDEIEDYRKEIEELTKIIIQEAKLIATTLTKSYMNEEVLNRDYDCVIIDEISMAPLPAVWYASNLATKRVVVVGDFFQLPPVVKHELIKKRKTDEELAYEQAVIDNWLKRDVFDVAGITSAIRENTNLPVTSLRQLKEQYRMEEPIANLVNHLVYSKYSNGKYSLSTANNEKNKPDPYEAEPLAGSRLGIYDTSNQKPYVSTATSGSKYCILNALLSVRLAEKALKSGYEKVGIVTAYRAQANLTQMMLKDKNLNVSVEADTVHRFQGGEKPLIIFDITTPYTPSMYDDGKDDGTDEKLLNVAISRAQNKCIVLGDVKTIESRHSHSSLIRKMLVYLRQQDNPFIPSNDLLDEFTETQETDEWLKKIKLVENPKGSTVFDEKDFYQNFLHDVFEAKQELILVSPFITAYRSEQMMPALVNAQKRGVKIFVLTRHPSNHTGQMVGEAQGAIKKLEEHNITVLPFKKSIHQKIAIVDRKVLWEGSLNILSQRDSGEYMRRFSGKGATAEQVLKFLRLDKNIGNIGSNNLKRCEYCSEPGSYYWNDVGRFGEWTFCLQRSHKQGETPKTEKEVKAKKQQLTQLRKSEKQFKNGVPICPVHDVEMVIRKRHWDQKEFWGCPEFRRLGCKVTHEKEA